MPSLRLRKASAQMRCLCMCGRFADSLYPSEYESWSHLLTGTQGEDPGYDPMEYMVNAAHEQNMQFHAWINPLRIASTTIPPELDEA